MPVAIGDVTSFTSGDRKSIVLLAPTTATNGAPSSASAGLATTELFNCFTRWPSAVGLQVFSTAGSGVMTATGRLWGYIPSSAGGDWKPLGPGADSTKGVINLTAAMGETSADKIRHDETLDRPSDFERLYFEVTAIGGTSTSITAELIVGRDS